MLAYEGVTQKDKPIAQAHLAEARVRLRALRGLLADTVGEIETTVAAGDPVPRSVRGEARLAAAHIVHESRAVMVIQAGAARKIMPANPERVYQGVRGQRPLPRTPAATDQAGRRRDLRPRGVRLRHQPRTRRGAHTGYEGATDRNDLEEGESWPTIYAIG